MAVPAKTSASSLRLLRPGLLLFLFLLSISNPPLLVSADELTVTSHPAKLQLPPGHPVEDSPGSKPGSVMACNRVQIRGIPRLRHLNRFAHALKVRVAAVEVDPSSRVPSVEVCLHRNATIGVGMCPSSRWEKVAKGSWVQSMSPFNNKILDVRLPRGEASKAIEVSTEEEFLVHRVGFLVVGIILMAFARILSESVVFYYGSAMTVGIILVILMVLFQGMRLLPTGRKSSLAIFLYSSIVGVATFILQYLSGLLRSILVEIGIAEDMHNPLAIFLLVCLFLAGAWLGFWGVRKLVLAEDGSVDESVAHFVDWSIWIFAAAMILQSSLDGLLATEALVLGIIITATMRLGGKSRFFRRLCRRTIRFIRSTQIRMSPSEYSPTEYPHHARKPGSVLRSPQSKPFRLASCTTPVLGSTKTPEVPLERETYYSTFHDTPERKRFSKEEWKEFTRDSTRRAMEELSSSPAFARWVAANAERIAVTPTKDSGDGKKTQRRFLWF